VKEDAARRRTMLEGFLAKIHDVPRGEQKGTTEEEAQGCVRELVRRLRLLHQIDEGELWLMLLTTDEKQKLLAYRAKVEGKSPEPKRKKSEGSAEDRRARRREPPSSTGELFRKGMKVASVLDEVGLFDAIDRYVDDDEEELE